MDKKYIICNIEKLINGELTDFEYIKNEKGNRNEKALENILIRLINTYYAYKNGIAGVSDYISVLRSFLISFKTELRIDDNSFLNNNKFGIYYNKANNKFYATYDIPSYIKYKSFIEDSFVKSKSDIENNTSLYCLNTNKFINELTGFTTFKSIEQKLCVWGALRTPKSYTTLISMPTGGGKSLVTQTISYENDGLTIVVVPTVSLAIDQKRVAQKNIKTAKENEIFCYYSGCKNYTQILNSIKNKTARLLFISPEALIKNDFFQKLIDEANSLKYIKNIVIDEAHIVVAWGDFFRVDYQCLGPWRRDLLKKNPDIRTYLLSATFKDDTVKILKKIFSEDEKWIELRCDSLRKEPRYIFVKAAGNKDKKNKVIDLINILPKPMIIYVNSPFDANRCQSFLYYNGYHNIKTFTGDTKSNDRQKIIQNWTEDQFEIIIATSAFGVGVDKPDVRSVLHLYVPESPDSYYQELGRGGRDGLQSLSVMCVDNDDISKAFNHVNKVLTTQKLWGRWWSMYKNPNNMWSGGEIAVFASTKPNYSRINYFEEGNDSDEKWNINVLLLLNRYGLINISSIELDNNNRYIFTIKILDETITSESDKSISLFDSIRSKEAAKSISSFQLIRNAIERDNINCWSSMFYDTYPLVSEYCPGCNAHENIVEDEPNIFPLLINPQGPKQQLSYELSKFFSNTHEALFISPESIKQLICEFHPSIVVSDDTDKLVDDYNPELVYLNFYELRTLMKYDNGFFISGLIIAIYSNDSSKNINEYQIIKKCITRGNSVIHITNKDFCISKATEKTISFDVDGKVIK